jgi:hypothetical protein
MDIRDKISMPISLVKETPGSALLKVIIKSYEPTNNFYKNVTFDPKSMFVGIGNESKEVLTHSMKSTMPRELAITLEFTVLQKVEQMV